MTAAQHVRLTALVVVLALTATVVAALDVIRVVGERGDVSPVVTPETAGGFLLIAGMAGMVVMRRWLG